MSRGLLVHICVMTCCILIAIQGSASQEPVLTVWPYEPVVYSPMLLTCNYSGSNDIGLCEFNKNGSKVAIVDYYRNCLVDSPNFTAVCSSTESYTLKFDNVSLDLHDSTWRCEQLGNKSEPVTLTIQVPVKSIEFEANKANVTNNVLTFKENTRLNVMCTTSSSRPIANVTWYLTDQNGNNKVDLPMAQNSNSSADTHGLISTISKLNINFNRTFNGWILGCNASNTINAVSRNISLNITYATNKPSILCTNNGIYKVIENTPGNLTCTVDGGNPAGTLKWNCTGDKTDYWGPQNSVTKTLVWNATQSQYCTCNSSNMAGYVITSVKAELLYPPVLGEMQNISVFEGDNVTLKCNVTGANPPVNEYEWTPDTYNENKTQITIPNISRTDDTEYTCTAYNTMKPSCKAVVTGNASKSIHVDILYPPSITIPQGKTFTVNESGQFNYTCLVLAGNPDNTNVIWTNNTNTWNSKELNISYVTRYDDSAYTCHASNLMINSENKIRIGNVSADIRLIVQFKTKVTNFYVEGYKGNTSVTVNESVPIQFVCRLEGKPTSEVKIYETDRLVDSSNANVLSYHTTSSCTGGPVNYTCNGSNSLNTIPSTRDIELFVNCKPRRNMNMSEEELNVTSALNMTATLNYIALAYPHPEFIWQRNGSTIKSCPHTNVSSSGLSTTLTISTVKESDFGEYKLNVTNEIDTIEETFQLKPQGPPETPTNVAQNNDTTTDSVISLTWTPGFNNGLEQNFTVLYKQVTAGNWQSVTVNDTRSIVGCNITELQGDSVYDVVVFSSNALGTSKSNATLRCKTKPSPISSTKAASSSSPVIPAVAGSVSAVVILVVVCAIVFFIRRRRMQSKPPPTAPVESETSDVCYATVDKRKKEKPPMQTSEPLLNDTSDADRDTGVYENAEPTKKKRHGPKTNETASEQPGMYVNCSKKKPEEIPMKTIQHKSKGAATNPPPIPSKTALKNGLQEIDERDEHISSAEDVYVNQGKIERIESVFVNELFDFVAGKSLQSFAPEFMTLPTTLIMPYNDAMKPENIKLNRYNGIFPYDHSRVKIPEDPDFFTNANYIDGYKKEKRYIASLGPTEETSDNFKTFWKMVWYEKSDIIVMVTNLRELTGMKCEMYWPLAIEVPTIYGDVSVTWVHVKEYAEYTVRTFNISKANETRTVTQLHFTAWPDKGVPDDLTSLLEFLQRIKHTPSTNAGPMIVHCSAGIGRTGTLIALDRIIEEGKATNAVNLSRCVLSMRQQRTKMIQTLEQYVYVYKASVYALTFECEPMTVEELPNKIKATTDAQYGEQFNMLNKIVDNESEDEKKAIQDNRNDKSNRPSAEIPGDRHRVRLYIDKQSEESDYINAVYINSFKTKSKFIVAQSPLRDFVEDFICMIFQDQCVCVIDLDGNTPSSLDVGIYLPPKNQPAKFETFTVTCDTLDSNSKYTVRKLEIKNTGPHYSGKWTTYHFKYHDWKHGKETPGDVKSFVEFYKEVEAYAAQFGEKESHILVHCLDASTRSGLYCYMSCLLEKIHCERRVNVGNTLRQVRNRRKTTIKSVKQLKFCYKALETYVGMNMTN